MTDYFATGILAYTDGDKAEAFRNFRLAIRENPHNADAWYWLSLVVEDADRKRDCLLRCLDIEPTHASALDSLQQLESAERAATPAAPGEVLALEGMPAEEKPILFPEAAPEEDQPILFADLDADELPGGANKVVEPGLHPDETADTPPLFIDLDSDLRALAPPTKKERRSSSRRKISGRAILILTIIFILVMIISVIAVWFLLPGFRLPFAALPNIPNFLNPAPAGLPSGDSPEGAAANWLNAVISRKSLDIARITCVEKQVEVQSSTLKNELLEAILRDQARAIPQMNADLSRLRFTPFEPTETSVRVLVSGVLRLTQGDAVQEYPVDDRFTIIHEDGRWKWCGSDALKAAGIAATQQAGAPTPTQNIPPPAYRPDEWRMESIAYREIPSGEGWTEIQVDLVVENYSPYLGLVQMNSGGRVATLGGEYPIEYDFNVRVLPGLRTHSDRSGAPLSIRAQIPAQSEDLFIHIPFRVELIELVNGQTVSGKGEFRLDPLYTLSGTPDIFVNAEWEVYQANPPSGIYAAGIGEAVDFNAGLWTFKSLEYEAASAGSATSGNLVLRGILENPAAPTNGETGASLTLSPADADGIQFLRVSQWGSVARADQTMGAIQAAPGHQQEAAVWSLSRDQFPALEPETWCFIGFFKAQEDDHIQDLVLFSCMPVLPP